jgi:predicted RNA-binding Zn ribbon-like protein
VDNNLNNQDDNGFLFVSGRLFLDFVNTEIMQMSRGADLISDWEAMSAWFVAAGLLSSDAATLCDFRQTEQKEALATVLHLRRALRALTEALSQAKVVPQESLDAINAVLARSPRVLQIAEDKETGTYSERFVNERDGLIPLLAPIAQDAADLLCHGECAFVRQCENPQCILFFYDTTKNHGRRWCRMTACGNRAKAAAHYHRQRQSK